VRLLSALSVFALYIFASVLLTPLPLPAEQPGLVQLPAVGAWNGFLDQLNVVECLNHGPRDIQFKMKLFRSSGAVIEEQLVVVPAHGSTHTILNNFEDANGIGIGNSYGVYQLEDVFVPPSSNLVCFTAIYRLQSGSATPEYAYTLPIVARRSETQTGI